MSHLLVDFPEGPRGSSTEGKRVRFAPMASLTCVDKYVDCKSKIWYSDVEFRAMRARNQEAINSALEMMRILHPASADDPEETTPRVPLSQLTDITGIERMLGPIFHASQARRLLHLDAVLDEQERQDLAGERDALKLAFAPHEHSRKSMKLARKIGISQSRV